MVDLFEFTLIVAENANIIVDYYYWDILKNHSYQSDDFKKGFAEHFCSFTGSSLEPYITKNTAASHCLEHLKCIEELIQGL